MTETLISAPIVDTGAARRRDLDGMVAKVNSREQAQLVAREFERMFLAEMLQPMFSGISTEAPFGGGMSEDMFRPMLLDQYADAISKAGGVGIADAVMKEILRLQGLE